MSNFFDKLDREFDKNIIVDIANVVHGDMPGDKVSIDDTHIAKAKIIFVELLDKVKQLNKEKIVISVCGGSGVGKSETASLLSYFFKREVILFQEIITQGVYLCIMMENVYIYLENQQ